MNLMELRQRKANLLTEARAIHEKAGAEKRELTAEEVSGFNNRMSAVEAINTDIKREEALANEERSAEAANHITGASDATAGTPSGTSWVASKNGISSMRSPKAFRSFGEQLTAIKNATTQHGRGTMDPRLMAGPAGANEATPSEGGFLVQTDFAAEILHNIYSVGQIAGSVRHKPISSGANSMKINAVDERSRQNGQRNGGIAAFWANEAGTLSATKPKFRQLEFVLNKLTALVYATDEMLADSTFLGSMIGDVVPDELRFRVDDAILNGLGDGQPKGIQQSNALIVQPKDTNQATGTLSYTNVLNVYSRAFASGVTNSKWVINQSVYPQLFALNQTGAAGQLYPVYLPPGGISGRPYGTIFGLDVVPVEQTAVLGTQGDFSLFDLNQYMMIDKGDIQTATSIHVRFLEDESVFRFIYRADGRPLWDFQLTPFAKNAPTLSPFVTLASRP